MSVDGPLVDGLSVVLPAYNEQENIARAVLRATEVLPGLAEEWEVIVVDDGSSDQTAEIARNIVSEHYPNVRLLKHQTNQGYGAALRSGFIHARHELVFYTDSDNQFDLGELRYALPMMRDADVLVGFRVYRYDEPARLALSWAYNVLVRILFRVRVRDVDCAFKVFRREVIDKISIETDNFFVDTELVAKARKWNFRIVEKGVRHYPRTAGETTVSSSDIPRTLAVVFQMWQRIHRPTRRQLEAAAARRLHAEDADIEVIPSGDHLKASEPIQAVAIPSPQVAEPQQPN
jgi:glycosyltransferase involved in cell wall biosynthesis